MKYTKSNALTDAKVLCGQDDGVINTQAPIDYAIFWDMEQGNILLMSEKVGKKSKFETLVSKKLIDNVLVDYRDGSIKNQGMSAIDTFADWLYSNVNSKLHIIDARKYLIK